MPSKISFFKSILWKLFLYMMIVVIFACAVVMVLIGPPRGKEAFPVMMERHIERTAMTGKIISQQYTRGDSFDSICENLKTIGFLSESYVKLIDTKGKTLFSSDVFIPGYDVNTLTLNKSEIENLKKGSFVSGQKSLSLNDSVLTIHYSAFPVSSNIQMEGAVLSIIPVGPPSPSKKKVRETLLKGTLTVFFLISVAALVISWNFVRPILKMKRVAEKLAKGDFSTKINLKNKDEMGALADTFDYMSSKLKENIEGRMKLMGDISHEINSPLSAVRVNIEATLDGVIDINDIKEREKVLNSILNQIQRISMLVRDLLELSKFEARIIKMDIKPFSVLEPLKSVVESLEQTASEKNISISLKIAENNLKAIGDETRIAQVIQNLVSNAINHNPPGTNVTVEVSRKNDGVFFLVEDNGIGIPENEIESVFKRFYQVKSGRNKERKGSGLGLAIVKEIIEAHGSLIKVESHGKSTRFFFSISSG